MPTFDRTDRFKRDYERLSPDEKTAIKAASKKFLHDLPSGNFRRGLRVKRIQSAEGVFEMTFSGDGRATFEYGAEVRPGEKHVIWRRCGGHEILDKTR